MVMVGKRQVDYAPMSDYLSQYYGFSRGCIEYSSPPVIHLGSTLEFMRGNIDALVQTLTHEWIHLVLYRFIGGDVTHLFDNIAYKLEDRGWL